MATSPAQFRWPQGFVLALALGLIGALTYLMLASGWPAPHLDSVLYFQLSSHVAAGDGFLFSNYSRLYFARGVDNWLFDLHGQLFWPLLGWLSPGSDYSALLRGAALLSVITFFLSAGLALLITRALALKPWLRVGVVLALALGLSFISVSLMGRPEQGIGVVLVLAAIARQLRPHWDAALIQGATIGLIAAFSPLAGVLAGALYAWLGALDHPPRKALLFVLRLGLSALGTWALLIILVSPFWPWEILRNTLMQFLSAYGSGYMSRMYVLWELSVDPRKPGIALAWLLAGSLVIFQAARSRANGYRWAVTLVGGLLVALLLYKTSMERTLTYNFIGLALIPLERAWQIWTSLDLSARKRRIGAAVIALACALPGLGFVDALLSWQSYRHAGATLAEAQHALAPYLAKMAPSERIVVSEVSVPPLFLLEARPKQMVSVADLTAEQVGQVEQAFSIQARYAILPPWMASSVLPNLSNYRVVENFPSSCADPLGCQVPGYAFLLLERVPIAGTR